VSKPQNLELNLCKCEITINSDQNLDWNIFHRKKGQKEKKTIFNKTAKQGRVGYIF
jgi:hypothetical protein